MVTLSHRGPQPRPVTRLVLTSGLVLQEATGAEASLAQAKEMPPSRPQAAAAPPRGWAPCCWVSENKRPLSVSCFTRPSASLHVNKSFKLLRPRADFCAADCDSGYQGRGFSPLDLWAPVPLKGAAGMPWQSAHAGCPKSSGEENIYLQLHGPKLMAGRGVVSGDTVGGLNVAWLTA